MNSEELLKRAPEYFRAAIHVRATALGLMQRPVEEQMADVKVLLEAVGELTVPSEFEKFLVNSQPLFFDALKEHYLTFNLQVDQGRGIPSHMKYEVSINT